MRCLPTWLGHALPLCFTIPAVRLPITLFHLRQGSHFCFRFSELQVPPACLRVRCLLLSFVPRSPTAFSIHVKRKQTPGKAGDDGWVSVHYMGRALADYRRGWLLSSSSPACSCTPVVETLRA